MVLLFFTLLTREIGVELSLLVFSLSFRECLQVSVSPLNLPVHNESRMGKKLVPVTALRKKSLLCAL